MGCFFRHLESSDSVSFPFAYLKPVATCHSVCLCVCLVATVTQNLCGFLLCPQNSFLLCQLCSPSLWWAVKWAIIKIQSLGCGLKFGKAFVMLIKWVSFHLNIFRNLCAWVFVVSVWIKLYIVLTRRRRCWLWIGLWGENESFLRVYLIEKNSSF